MSKLPFNEYLLNLHAHQVHKPKGDFLSTTANNTKKRLASANKRRKNTRHNNLMQRRNLDACDMTDSLVEEDKKNKEDEKVEPKPDRRREMLMLWKAQKEKRKQELMQKKPVFKVSHAIGFPTATEALSTIKGKVINSAQKTRLNSATKTTSNLASTNKLSGQKSSSVQENGVSTRSTVLSRKKLDFFGSGNLELPGTSSKTSVNGITPLKFNRLVSKSAVRNSPRRKPKEEAISKVKNKKSPVKKVKKDPVIVETNVTKRKKQVLIAAEVGNATPKNKSRTPQKTKAKQTTPHPKKKAKTEKETLNNSKSDMSQEESSPITPEVRKEVPVYVSPFVTISRGKDSARKEFKQRRSGELSVLNTSTGPKAGAAYFRFTLDNEIERLQGICKVWNEYKESNDLPDGACEMIDVAIGQTQLLIAKKFEQFRGLINSCEQQIGEKPVTCEDLHGFWDMVYIQVVNLNTRFENLEKVKACNWEEIMPEKAKEKKPEPKKRGRPPKKASATSSLRDAIKAARAAKSNNLLTVENPVNTFDGGFFKVLSPQKNIASPKPQTLIMSSSKRKSLLGSVLIKESNKRTSAILTATHSAKKVQSFEVPQIPEKTPGKSILKTDKLKSSTRKSRVAFFDEQQLDNKENVTSNVQVKGTPRRSERLSKRTLSFEDC